MKEARHGLNGGCLSCRRGSREQIPSRSRCSEYRWTALGAHVRISILWRQLRRGCAHAGQRNFFETEGIAGAGQSGSMPIYILALGRNGRPRHLMNMYMRDQGKKGTVEMNPSDIAHAVRDFTMCSVIVLSSDWVNIPMAIAVWFLVRILFVFGFSAVVR